MEPFIIKLNVWWILEAAVSCVELLDKVEVYQGSQGLLKCISLTNVVLVHTDWAARFRRYFVTSCHDFLKLESLSRGVDVCRFLVSKEQTCTGIPLFDICLIESFVVSM